LAGRACLPAKFFGGRRVGEPARAMAAKRLDPMAGWRDRGRVFVLRRPSLGNSVLPTAPKYEIQCRSAGPFAC